MPAYKGSFRPPKKKSPGPKKVGGPTIAFSDFEKAISSGKAKPLSFRPKKVYRPSTVPGKAHTERVKTVSKAKMAGEPTKPSISRFTVKPFPMAKKKKYKPKKR